MTIVHALKLRHSKMKREMYIENKMFHISKLYIIFSFYSPEEAQINANYLNIRINEDGYLVADIQNILPPQRDICLDLYTGLVFSRTDKEGI